MLESNNVKLIVVHCSDTNDKENLKAIDIHKMHLGFGWDGIGYHKVICRPEYWIGAHTKSKNDISLGVCLIGSNKFTKKQYISLEKVLRKWKLLYPKAKILGHRDVGNTKKTCPNFDVISWSKNKNI